MTQQLRCDVNEADEASSSGWSATPGVWPCRGTVLTGARLASDGEPLAQWLASVASAWLAGERVAIYVKYKAVRVFTKTKTHQCHSIATLGYLALFWGWHLPNREL